MSTTAGPTLVSVEEYLRRTEKPNCEYIDGVLYPKALATTSHARTQWSTLTLLRRQGVEAVPELTVRVRPTRFLVPDVAAAHDLESPYPTKPVLLCVEILSPEDRLGAMLAKCEEYHAWGVPFCWVIDPDKQTAWEYHRGGEPVRVASRGVLRAGEIAISLEELFAEANLPQA